MAQSALIGALYVLLTVIVAPISSGLMQVRISEALCILPFFSFSAVPGLFIGCLLANLVLGAALPDIIFGSLTTLLAALLTYAFKRWEVSKYFAPMPAVILNAVVIGQLLCYVYEVGVPLYACMMYVGAGEALACYGLGMPLLIVLEGKQDILFGKRHE